jgi:hypothetical protein
MDFNPKIGHDVYIVYLKRDALNNWKIEDYRYNTIKLEFDQVKSLVSKHDLTTSFSGKENYKTTNYPRLTPTEIENNKAQREREDNREQKQ